MATSDKIGRAFDAQLGLVWTTYPLGQGELAESRPKGGVSRAPASLGTDGVNLSFVMRRQKPPQPGLELLRHHLQQIGEAEAPSSSSIQTSSNWRILRPLEGAGIAWITD